MLVKKLILGTIQRVKKKKPINTSRGGYMEKHDFVIYRCPMCGNDDEFTEFCSGCAVEFSQKPFEIFDIESEDVISVKCEKCGYQSDPSEFLIE